MYAQLGQGWSRPAVGLLAVASAAAIAVADVVNPEYSPLSEMVSRYVNGTAGWLITAAILGMGTASVLVAWQLRGVARRTGRRASAGGRTAAGRWAAVGWWALAVWAGGLLVAGIFPADPPGRWSRPSPSEMVHGTAAWVAIAAFPVAAVLLTRALPDRRRLCPAAVASVLATAVFAVYMVDVLDGPSLGVGGVPTLVGLTERLMIAANLVWLALAAAGAPATAGSGTGRAVAGVR